jgi:hypothetical protein
MMIRTRRYSHQHRAQWPFIPRRRGRCGVAYSFCATTGLSSPLCDDPNAILSIESSLTVKFQPIPRENWRIWHGDQRNSRKSRGRTIQAKSEKQRAGEAYKAVEDLGESHASWPLENVPKPTALESEWAAGLSVSRRRKEFSGTAGTAVAKSLMLTACVWKGS